MIETAIAARLARVVYINDLVDALVETAHRAHAATANAIGEHIKREVDELDRFPTLPRGRGTATARRAC